MGKDIGRIYKHSQSQFSTLSLKTPVSSSQSSQTSSAIEWTTTYFPSAKDKHQNNTGLYSQNTVQNDATITINDKIQSSETPKTNYKISNIATPNHHSQHIASTSSSRLNTNTPTILPPVGKEYICFTICNWERHWANLQTQSIPTLNFVTQGTC